MTKVEMINVKQALAKSAEGVSLIGWFVYWSINNVQDSHTALVQRLKDCGLDTDCAPEVKPKSAFISSVEETAKVRKARHQKIIDDAARCVYVIVSTHVDPQNVDVTFTVETKATFSKATQEITVSGPFEGEIRANYEKYRDTYFSDHFRLMVLRLLGTHCQYLTIRDRGGLYFVPSVHEEGLKRIKSLFSHYPDSEFETVGVANMAEARRSMWKSMIGEVNAELRAMKEEISAMGPDPSDFQLNVKLTRYQELRDKVENYELVLNDTASTLRSELAEISSALRNQMAA